MTSQEGSSLLKSCARRSFSFTWGNLQGFATHPHSLGDPWFEKHWIKLKGFDESLNMNVFTLHADRGIICLLCSKHPVVNTGRRKNCNVFTTEPARPQRPSKLDNHISSDQHQNAISMKKNQRASLFHCMHQDRITNKVSTVAERVHLIYWVMKEEIANRKIASLQTLVDSIGHNDRLRDLRHISSTAVIEFILLISEHLSNHIVSAVKESPCWLLWSMKPPILLHFSNT